MKIKILLLGSLLVGSQIFVELKATDKKNPACLTYGTIGFCLGLTLSQIVASNPILEQTSNVMLSTLGKTVENNLAAQVIKGYQINKIATSFKTAMEFAFLSAGWVASIDWHHKIGKNGDDIYKKNVCLKLGTGLVVGASVGLALNAYVKQYLR